MLHVLDDTAHPTSVWIHPKRKNPHFQIPFIFFSAPILLSVSLPLTNLSSPLSDPQGVIFFFFFLKRLFQWVLQGGPWGSHWDQFKKDAPFSPLLGPLGSLVLFIRNLQAFDLPSFPHTPPPSNCCSKFLSELTSGGEKKKKKKSAPLSEKWSPFSVPVRQWIKVFHSQDGGWDSLIFEDSMEGCPGRLMVKKFNGPRGGCALKTSGGL